MKKTEFKPVINQAMPNFIGQQLLNANAVADTIMIGHISTAQLASLGIATNIYVSIYIPFMAILLGLIPLISRASGNKDFRRVISLTRQGSWLAIIFSLIAIIFLIYPNLFFAITKSAQSVNNVVRHYLIAIACGMPAILLFRIYFAFFTGILQPKVVMYICLVTLIIKLILNVVLVYGILPQSLSAVGCAISTTTVNWLAVIIGFIVIKKHKLFTDFQFIEHLPFFNFKEQWEILKIGVPIGIAFVIDFTFFTITGLFIARLGTVSAAANQIVGNLCYLIYLVPLSISTAISALTARQIGAHNYIGAKYIGNAALQLGGVVSFILGLCFIVFHNFLASIYTSEPHTLLLASQLLLLVGVYHFIDALLTITAGILRGYQKTFIPTIIFAVTLWPIGLGGGYYLAFKSDITYLQGPGGFWVALIASVTIANISMLWYYQTIASKQNEVLGD